MVTEQGMVETRIIKIPIDLPPSRSDEATNYLNSCIPGKTLQQVRLCLEEECQNSRVKLDGLVVYVLKKGLGTWAEEGVKRSFIIRGQSHLLRRMRGEEEIGHLQGLFCALERQEVSPVVWHC